MESNELIQNREFGEKFNELTSFIYDNFSTLKTWALKFVVPCALLIAALNKYFPNVEEDSVELIVVFVDMVLVCMFSIVIVTLLKPYFFENKPLKEIRFRSSLPQITKNMFLGLVSACLPLICVFLMSYLMKITNVPDNIPYRLVLFLKLAILILFSIPVYQTINVTVMEGESGLKCFSRAFKLSTYDVLVTATFIFLLFLIGSILPLLYEIPRAFISTIDSLFFFENNQPLNDLTLEILDYLSLSLSVFFMLLEQFMIIFAMILEYGNAVERVDNVSFMKKFNEFDNL